MSSSYFVVLFRQLIVRNSKDPTFVFLAILWSALYAWDESLEALYAHFSWLVSGSPCVVDGRQHILLTFPCFVGFRNPE